jgi:hypothetical protein
MCHYSGCRYRIYRWICCGFADKKNKNINKEYVNCFELADNDAILLGNYYITGIVVPHQIRTISRFAWAKKSDHYPKLE